MLGRRMLWILAAVGLGFVTTFLYTMWLLGGPPVAVHDSNDQLSRVSQGAELVRVFVFGSGEPGPSVVMSVPLEWVGLTSTQFEASHPEWRMVSFSPHRIVVEELCPEDLEGGFLRAEDGAIVVYAGTPDGCHRRTDSLEVDMEAMSPFQRSELATGVSFTTDFDLSLLLDGMRAP